MKNNAPVKPLSFKKKKKRPTQYLADGGEVVGPSHEQGGMNAKTQDGTPVANIEGDERIFSREDNAYMEREARRIVGLLQKNPQMANQAAQQLGFKVVEMIIQQEKNQRAEEGQPTEDVEQANAAINNFSNEGQEESV